MRRAFFTAVFNASGTPRTPSLANQWAGDFITMPHDPNQPCNAIMQTGLQDAIGSLGALEWQPRFGFTWQPRGTSAGTVVRGGFGVFADNFDRSFLGHLRKWAPFC